MSAHVPIITLTYLAILGLLYGGLTMAIVVLRGRYNIPYGDGDNPKLLRAMRAHGNFQEWVPLVSLLVAGLEMSGTAMIVIHLLMGTLLGARCLHALGIYSAVGTPLYLLGRISGALSTWLVLLTASSLALTKTY